MNIILPLLLLFSSANSFSLVPKFRDYGFCLTTPIMSCRTPILNMDYSRYKSFDDIINILPEFHTRIIINNWLKYVAPEEVTSEDLRVDYDKDYVNDNKIEEHHAGLKFFPEYLIKSLYDFKIFIAINREEKNLIYFAWCPDAHLPKAKLVYIMAGKVYDNTIYIHRIAQNPYYDNILGINSMEMVERLADIDYRDGEKFQFNYDKLHEYDNRYQISWNFYKN